MKKCIKNIRTIDSLKNTIKKEKFIKLWRMPVKDIVGNGHLAWI